MNGDKKSESIFGLLVKRFGKKPYKRGKRTSAKIKGIEKRQKFLIAIFVLALGLLIVEHQFSRSGLYSALALSFLTEVFLFWALRQDIKENKSGNLFILPFFYTLGFSLFYFSLRFGFLYFTPASLVSQLIWTALYAFGLYSMFLSQNIFAVASIRTIALLSGARIVSFVLTLLTYFFLTNITFTLHLSIYFTVIIFAIYTFFLVSQSLWTYRLVKETRASIIWTAAVTLCLVEMATMLWFWPSSPTVIAIFLSGFFYTLVGLSHVWLERRLFRGVLWEYVWVGAIVFFALLLFSPLGQ